MNLNHIAKKPFFDLFYRSPCMALLLRASFHDAGTFNIKTKTGGPRGTLRFELDRPENKGLDYAVEQIEDIKNDGNHITAILSYADLVQLGGYAAVEYAGGPAMHFRMGRRDAPETELEPHLPDVMSGNPSDKMGIMGFSPREFVALMGSHTLGFAHMDRSGHKGRWTQNPHVFDNTYYKEVLLGDKTKYLRTRTEIILGEDREFRRICEEYAQDEALFFSDYAAAHVKMSELGQEEHLLSEFDAPST